MNHFHYQILLFGGVLFDPNRLVAKSTSLRSLFLPVLFIFAKEAVLSQIAQNRLGGRNFMVSRLGHKIGALGVAVSRRMLWMMVVLVLP